MPYADDAFEAAIWDREARRKSQIPFRHVLILQSPLDSAEKVQKALGLPAAPVLEQAILTGAKAGEVEGQAIQVCTLGDAEFDLLFKAARKMGSFTFTYTWILYKGERRPSQKVKPNPYYYLRRDAQVKQNW